jgi:hypothetical protein
MNVQLEPLPESALSVRQTPPPAAAAQTRHLDCVQFGSIASAVMRPDVVYEAPLNVRTFGKFAVLGPASVQLAGVFGPLPTPRALTLTQAF